jgi:glutathione-regulated potassium-efflux system ancillary protein KefC
MAEIDEPQTAPVIIAGFGRYGQIVGRLLMPTASAHRAGPRRDQVEAVRRFGWLAFYGDATRLDLLRTAGADQARVLVLAIDDVEQSVALVDLAREHFPQPAGRGPRPQRAALVPLRERGVQHIERETFDSALMSARSVLETMGFERHQARNLALRFRRHNLEQLEEAAPHFKDETKLMSDSARPATMPRRRAGTDLLAAGPTRPACDQRIPSQSSLAPVKAMPV